MAGDNTGRFLVLLTWVLMLFANYVSVSQIFNNWFASQSNHSYYGYSKWGLLLLSIYQFFSIMASVCHIRAVFGNPGTTDKFKEAPPGFRKPRICKFCGLRWKPPRAHHCRKCQKCIFRMDHHCAWIDNCVGIGNQKFFILFLIYSAILCGYQLVLLVISVLLWVIDATLTIVFMPTFLGLCILLKSVTFLYMTTDFLSEQLDALETNSTLVESHQHTHGTQKDLWTHVTEVFGSDWRTWLLPTTPTLELDFTDKVVAAQARNRQKQQHFHASDHHPHQNEMQRIKLVKTDPEESAFTSSAAIYSDRLAELRQRQHSSKKEPKEADIISGKADCSNYNSTSEDRRHLYQSGDDFESSEDEQQHYRNIYIKPWTDIGVELDNDDETRYLRLEDLSDDYHNDEREPYGDDDSSLSSDSVNHLRANEDAIYFKRQFPDRQHYPFTTNDMSNQYKTLDDHHSSISHHNLIRSEPQIPRKSSENSYKE